MTLASCSLTTPRHVGLNGHETMIWMLALAMSGSIGQDHNRLTALHMYVHTYVLQ